MTFSRREIIYLNSLKFVKTMSFLIVLNILFDVLVYLESEDTNITYFRGVMVYIYILYTIIEYKIVRLNSTNHLIWFIVLYWLLLIPASSNIALSFKMYIKIVLPLIVYIVSSNLYPNLKYFRYLFIAFSCVIIFSVLYGIVSNIFGLKDAYALKRETIDTFSIGLGDGKLYSQAVATVIFPFIWFTFNLTKKQKLLIGILVILVILFSILSLRRTTLIIIVLNFTLFYFFSDRTSKAIRIIPPIVIVLLMTFSLWFPILESRMSLRTNTFSADYNIEEEGRYREVPMVINDILLSSDIKTMLFGKEIFNSNGNYGNGIFGTRMIHIDYMGILFGSGVIGLSLYLLMYISIIKRFKNLYKNNTSLLKEDLRSYKGLFYAIIICSMFISLSGQMYEMTFRSMIFFTLGIITSNLQNTATQIRN